MSRLFASPTPLDAGLQLVAANRDAPQRGLPPNLSLDSPASIQYTSVTAGFAPSICRGEPKPDALPEPQDIDIVLAADCVYFEVSAPFVCTWRPS